jgi:hypothetical protein
MNVYSSCSFTKSDCLITGAFVSQCEDIFNLLRPYAEIMTNFGEQLNCVVQRWINRSHFCSYASLWFSVQERQKPGWNGDSCALRSWSVV